MCYFENSRRLYYFPRWRATGYKVLRRTARRGLISQNWSEQEWEMGVKYRTPLDRSGIGPGFYAFRRKRDARKYFYAHGGVAHGGVVVKVRLSGEISKFASHQGRKHKAYAGYKSSEATLLKVY